MNALLKFTVAIEAVTGLALIVLPAIVVRLLLGTDIAGAGITLGRVAGIGLLLLGVACWPGRQRAGSGSLAFRLMLNYNGLAALCLACVGAVLNLAGVLLWPAVALHATVALLLGRTARRERRNSAPG